MHLRMPSIDQGVQAFTWAVFFFVLLWVGMLALGVSGATALILSLFLIRPTPFCLLDEVDAPLDEANIGRFNSIVQDMAETSQFILITHNRRTMEAAETLYGITMEKPGVSKVVSVRLREAA